jgi:hypothetical protein
VTVWNCSFTQISSAVVVVSTKAREVNLMHNTISLSSRSAEALRMPTSTTTMAYTHVVMEHNKFFGVRAFYGYSWGIMRAAHNEMVGAPSGSSFELREMRMDAAFVDNIFRDFPDRVAVSAISVAEMRNSAELQIDGCHFQNLNTSQAPLLVRKSTNQNRIRVNKVKFEDCTNTKWTHVSSAGGYGAAMAVYGDHVRVDLIETDFVKGNGTYGGSFACMDTVQMNLKHCNIHGNMAEYDGAGYCRSTCSFQALNCNVKDNTSTKGHNGVCQGLGKPATSTHGRIRL